MIGKKGRRRVAAWLLALVVIIGAGGYGAVCLGTDVVPDQGKKVSLEAGQVYKEGGYVVTVFGVKTGLEAQISGSVDNTVPAEYKITYRLPWNMLKKYSKTVEVRSNCDPEESGGYFVKGLILVNKNHPLKRDYAPGENPVAVRALKRMQRAAEKDGMSLPTQDGFRSYETQETLHRFWVSVQGEKLADIYSAKAGQSEHQTGLAFDIGLTDPVFANWPEAEWIEKNSWKYGFILRYPEGKEDITGYAYEPWHVRYVGKTFAQEIYESGLTLEEYLGDVQS